MIVVASADRNQGRRRVGKRIVTIYSFALFQYFPLSYTLAFKTQLKVLI